MNNLIDDLNNLSRSKLQKIAKSFQVSTSGDKNTLVDNIYNRYYDIKKYISYTYVRQLGHEGKDGRTFLATDEKGQECAIKIFKKTKKSKSIIREAKLQTIAADHGLSPAIVDYDGDGKYIVMEKLDTNLFDLFRQQNGELTISQQKAVIKLFKKLDECKIFHADPNPLNFMKKGNKWYIIDFGFAKPINSYTIHKYGMTPNMKYMPIGLILKLRGIYANSKLEYLEKYVQ